MRIPRIGGWHRGEGRMDLPVEVTVYEVGPRDGFQNLAQFIATETKIAFIDALSETGLPAIEATSFVSPKWVPQLADATEVMAGIHRRPGVRYPVLVPNTIGLENALDAGVDEIAVFTAASEAFNRRNINASISESIERFRPVVARAAARDVRIRGYVSTAFGCPYQGEVPIQDVLRVTCDLFDLGCHEVSIGDTIGVGDPAQVKRLVARLAGQVDLTRVALHLHDTYGRGLANVLAALESGITIFDSAAGGLGGCPYARGATGNLASEDLVAMLDRLGVRTGVDLDRLARASADLASATGVELPSKVLAAMGTPARRERVSA